MATFFVMGFCDIVGISSDYMQSGFGWVAHHDRFCTFNGVCMVFLFRHSGRQ